jgi:hypothetical protein
MRGTVEKLFLKETMYILGNEPAFNAPSEKPGHSIRSEFRQIRNQHNPTEVR